MLRHNEVFTLTRLKVSVSVLLLFLLSDSVCTFAWVELSMMQIDVLCVDRTSRWIIFL